MNQFINIRKAKQMFYGICICFLIIHISLILLFFRYRVMPMAYFNIFSILFYIFNMFLIHREKLKLSVILVYLEILIHMTLAECYTGWDNGFQITLIGMNILLFFAEYMARSMRYEHAPTFILSIMGMIAYLTAYVVVYHHPAQYLLPKEVSFQLQIIWGLVVFVIGIACLQAFVLLSFRSEEMLSSQVVRDELTGLHNRYYMSRYLHRIERNHSRDRYWIAMADIDNFKTINDTYGHNFGDYVLKSIADILKGSEVDAEFCRWGGEEFLMVGEIGSGMDVQCARLDSFRKTIEEYDFIFDGQQTKLTITIGVSPYNNEADTSDWINMADKKLYVGKSSGKNKVVS